MARMRRLVIFLTVVAAGAVLTAQPQGDSVEAHVAAARTAAGAEYKALADRLCAPSSQPPTAQTPAVSQGRAPGPPPRSNWYAKPVKVFDNLYFVGQSEYSAWAVVTSDGIIVIDPIFDYSSRTKWSADCVHSGSIRPPSNTYLSAMLITTTSAARHSCRIASTPR